MAATIRLKRSTGTSAPSSLATGEVAYSYGAGTSANSGDRLFFGKGDDGNGVATSVVTIGGEYFANLLDHTPGTLTASSALLVDANSKVDNFKVDNLDLNGNTISTTNTNGNLLLSPNGSGNISAENSKIINVTDPTAAQDAATKAYVDLQVGGGALSIAGDTGTDTINVADSDVTFAGGTALTSAVTNNTVTFNLDNTAVTPGSYGSSTAIPTFTVDQQGRLTAAGTASVSSSLSIAGETGTGTVSLLDSSLSVVGGTGIVTSASGREFTISTVDTEIVHDNLSGFVANEHIDHSGVSITAGNGLTGGGDITTSRTINVGEGTGITVAADTISTNDAEIVHDNLSGFVADEHVAHSGVTLTAGNGLTGGGDITTSRSFAVGAGTGISVNADDVQIDSAELASLYSKVIVHDNTNGFVANEHINHSSVSITAGNGLTGGGDITTSRTINVGEGTGITVAADTLSTNDAEIVHDNLSGFVADEHVAHTSVSITAGAGLTGGGDISTSRTINVVGGDGITANADEIEVTVDNSTIELSATNGTGAVRVKDGGITNAKLANSSVTIGSTAISLGGTSTVLAGLTQIDIDNIRILDNTVASSTGVLYIDPNPIDSDGGEVIIRGDLTVNGTTTTVNSTTVSINDKNIVLADSAATAGEADGAGLTINGPTVPATFTYNGGTDAWNMNKDLDLSSLTALKFAGENLTEALEDHLVTNFFLAGEGIDLTYNDGANTLTVAAEVATSANLGVASFDATEFTVTAGAVTLAVIDGGTY